MVSGFSYIGLGWGHQKAAIMSTKPLEKIRFDTHSIYIYIFQKGSEIEIILFNLRISVKETKCP